MTNYQVIYVESLSIIAILLLVLYIFHRISEQGQKRDELDAIYIIFIATAVLDSIWMLIDGQVRFRSWHMLLHVVYLSAHTPAGYLWLLYVMKHFPTNGFRIWKVRRLLIIPVLLVIISVLLSLRTGWVFQVDAGGTYHRGPWFMLPVLVQFGYSIIASCVALRCRHESALTEEKRRYGVAAFFPVPALLLASVQMILPPGLPSMQGGVLIALFLQYGVTQYGMITRDHLTDLPNRIAFERVLKERTDRYRAAEHRHLYLLSADLDQFKEINDTLGHPVGDQALILASDGLRDVFYKRNMIVFRIGGDEFMAIGESDRPLDIESIRLELNEVLKDRSRKEPFLIQMSMGMYEYDGTLTFGSLLEKVDRDLYLQKEAARET